MTKRRLVISSVALGDLEDIRAYTLNSYGENSADSYDRLIDQAFEDLESDPLRPGSSERAEIMEGLRSYHISFARKRAASSVKSPRHFVLYFMPTTNDTVVSRILHDARDLGRHLPDAHREAMDLGRVPEE